MQRIIEGFKLGLTIDEVKLYAKTCFSAYQMYEIYKGFESKLSIDKIKSYAKIQAKIWLLSQKILIEITF